MKSIKWLTHNRKAQCPPNPQYPNGKPIDLANGGFPTCKVDLPYPAPECGVWVVECDRCDASVGITAAGRVDDPLCVTIACKKAGFL